MMPSSALSRGRMWRKPSTGWGDLISSRLSQQKLCNFPFSALSSTPHACQAGKFYVSKSSWRDMKRPGRARYRFSPVLGVMQKCDCFPLQHKVTCVSHETSETRVVPGKSLCKRSLAVESAESSKKSIRKLSSPSSNLHLPLAVRDLWLWASESIFCLRLAKETLEYGK